VQAALADLQQAMLKLQRAQDQLVEADHQVGRAQHIARKSGFTDVFCPNTHTQSCAVVTNYRRMFFVTFLNLYSLVIPAEYRVATLPTGEHFSIKLD
jgi:hypothetical protein